MGKGRKHTQGIDWPTRKQSGKRPKEGRKRQAGIHTLGAKKNPAGVSLRGAAGVIGLLTVARKGG